MQEVQDVALINFEPVGYNHGFVEHQYKSKDLKPLKQMVKQVQKNSQKYNDYRPQLAGNIKEEYQLDDSIKPHINQLLAPLIEQYGKYKPLPKHLMLGNVWVNFQRKYEFNPPHTHDGVLSFVIWLDIPYTFEEEDAMSPGSKSVKPLSGRFAFNLPIGDEVKSYYPRADKTANGTILLFPSHLSHSVFPFYSSDKLRITVSANYHENPNAE